MGCDQSNKAPDPMAQTKKPEPDNTLVIKDRIKDVIKTGGEWLSSLDLENRITSGGLRVCDNLSSDQRIAGMFIPARNRT